MALLVGSAGGWGNCLIWTGMEFTIPYKKTNEMVEKTLKINAENISKMSKTNLQNLNCVQGGGWIPVVSSA